MKKYKFYSDAGHGWLEVEREELSRLNILEDITFFSYQRGSKVYLEEDCDLSTFIRAKFGEDEWKIKEFIAYGMDTIHQDHSQIRFYDNYDPDFEFAGPFALKN